VFWFMDFYISNVTIRHISWLSNNFFFLEPLLSILIFSHQNFSCICNIHARGNNKMNSRIFFQPSSSWKFRA
jgi:hypothetical protein